MDKEIADILAGADTLGWKQIKVDFGDDFLDIKVPDNCEILTMPSMPCLVDSAASITTALNQPTGSPTISDTIQAKDKPAGELTVCITVSDITRPVPYKGENGFLLPLLALIEGAGVKRENIVIVIGNGMHRPSTPEERIYMYGPEVVDNYRIVDHDCEDDASLVLAARTKRGTNVHLNKIFYEADVKIITGLVESHFMAGVSGGRKAVCPALVNTKTIEFFHSVGVLEDPKATNLILDGNPCHEEAMEVAKTVGVDFLVNVTLDKRLCMTGVFAGGLESAHMAAFEAMKQSVMIPIEKPYDIVITHAGYVGRNHYQAVKAAVNAMPAVRDNGLIVMLADNVDVEPIGSQEYKTFLHMLKILGPDGYNNILQHPDWKFTKDQWEPEMWGKPYRKVGMDGLIYCSPQIPEENFDIIPGPNGYDFIDSDASFATDGDKATAMLQNSIIYAVHHPRLKGRRPTVAYIEEGPYAIPMAVG
ncbi:MAG: nickel-dependent lactate racemase [Deltaproteobacteria bacterium]|jgi:nickel-dependent lactate racemase|nr:nickel-dependent lactate racemase [Deltaproteobacteria bacterium]